MGGSDALPSVGSGGRRGGGRRASAAVMGGAVPQMRSAVLGLGIVAAIEEKRGCGRGGERARVLRRRRVAAEGLIWLVRWRRFEGVEWPMARQGDRACASGPEADVRRHGERLSRMPGRRVQEEEKAN
uniref:Uncharacterized protein n=1 Tax=Oryza sativa subsp. japonica TaxID=39947 RepID=Q5Z4Q4_ORYSJ|nr:hypothetical protein [Oryza sativa Japonica Group]BAD62278.1 hypothetical protein [Oryza sativa Japonica Group]